MSMEIVSSPSSSGFKSSKSKKRSPLPRSDDSNEVVQEVPGTGKPAGPCHCHRIFLCTSISATVPVIVAVVINLQIDSASGKCVARRSLRVREEGSCRSGDNDCPRADDSDEPEYYASHELSVLSF